MGADLGQPSGGVGYDCADPEADLARAAEGLARPVVGMLTASPCAGSPRARRGGPGPCPPWGSATRSPPRTDLGPRHPAWPRPGWCRVPSGARWGHGLARPHRRRGPRTRSDGRSLRGMSTIAIPMTAARGVGPCPDPDPVSGGQGLSPRRAAQAGRVVAPGRCQEGPYEETLSISSRARDSSTSVRSIRPGIGFWRAVAISATRPYRTGDRG
jgi:hypothetical protein